MKYSRCRCLHPGWGRFMALATCVLVGGASLVGAAEGLQATD